MSRNPSNSGFGLHVSSFGPSTKLNSVFRSEGWAFDLGAIVPKDDFGVSVSEAVRFKVQL